MPSYHVDTTAIPNKRRRVDSPLSYSLDLPLEICTLIAKELPGDDVLRLRHEDIPFDFSSDLTRYHALVDYESKYPRWASIRRPLEELGRDASLTTLGQEMDEREALFWQHKKGVPRKLVASNEQHIGIGDWFEVDLTPILRFGRLVYMSVEEGTVCIVLRDLVGGKQGSVAIPGQQATAMTVTETHLAFALEDELCVIPLVAMNDEIGLDDEVVQTSIMSHAIYGMAGHNNTIAVLCKGDGKTSFHLCKNGGVQFIVNTECIAAIGLESDHFLLTFGQGETYNDDLTLVMRKYSFDGAYLGNVTSIIDVKDVQLRHNGNGWSGLVHSLATGLGQRLLEWCSEWVDRPSAVIWKDRMYFADSGGIEVFATEKSYRQVNKGELIGQMGFLGGADVEVELLIDDTFMVVQQLDKKFRRHKWFVFTFDDLPCLPGIEIGKEVVAGRYFWQPARKDGVDVNGWTCYGRRVQKNVAVQHL